jgi:hypothetical protein
MHKAQKTEVTTLPELKEEDGTAAPHWKRNLAVCVYATTRSIKDGYSDQMLELTNAATQGRLPNKQNFRSASKTTLFCRDDSASQLGKSNGLRPRLV